MGQAELARRMTEKLGRSVDRAAVNKMTKGTRDVSAGEMLAIMQITGASLPPQFAAMVPTELRDADRRTGPLSDEQARVVEVVIRAWLGWMIEHPAYQGRLQDQAVQAAAATIMSQLSRSRRFHEAVARDPEAALSAIQSALELMNDQ
jgi:DNA-binding transcriptional regulator YdaS (Cro superfamily)